ncbi:MAG: NAD(P)-dependent oxidoreductase [Roseitalea sp.]|jgi:3-hydroxyisobutyrate dehydrogenase|nr:NAD(P)-dependent oxidoreductase [Roseitalea sp.]MBO6722113.1 NAD(P)-dependent oxidoreductase [Roseitalea sp.]MBO6741733.1 NAD(P)-dependent oxidoreductase [Roseitalea sp.]
MTTQSRTPSEARAGPVGWIGVGKMGAPMAGNLLKSGIDVVVSDTVTANGDAMKARGARIVEKLASFDDCQTVFSTLPNDAALLSVVLGDEPEGSGLADILAPGSILVEMSTVSPHCSSQIADALAARDIDYLRAPISGSTALAETASVTILASGRQSAWDATLPWLRVMSSRQFYLGGGDEARFMKLVLNTMVGATSSVLSEALVLGETGGLDRRTMMEVICESAVVSPLIKYKVDAIETNDFAPAFSVAQMIKDFSLITEAGQNNGVPMFNANLILQQYIAAANSGLEKSDFFALVQWLRDMSRPGAYK